MSRESAGFDPEYFDKLFRIEDRHFWFRARNAAITSVLRGAVSGLEPGYRVLEVGCGTGNVLRVIENACPKGHVFGLDLFLEGLSRARHRLCCSLVQGDIRSAPFVASVDVVGVFDVLEHLDDDEGALFALKKLLRPGGLLLLTVPASPGLWSYFDEISCHRRRYDEADLSRKVEDAGFRVLYTTPYMAILYPVVWLTRRINSLVHRRRDLPKKARNEALAEHDLQVFPGVNGFMHGILRFETLSLRKRYRLPFGASLLMLAENTAAEPT